MTMSVRWLTIKEIRNLRIKNRAHRELASRRFCVGGDALDKGGGVTGAEPP